MRLAAAGLSRREYAQSLDCGGPDSYDEGLVSPSQALNQGF